jgi:uncharacterized phiE125 gp8 family phage protein
MACERSPFPWIHKNARLNHSPNNLSRYAGRADVVRRDITCSWARTVDPTEAPIELGDVKAQARITDDSSDALLDSYITTAVSACEDYMGRGLVTQTWQLTLHDFADVMPLPMAAPLQNDDEADPSTAVVVTYYDEDGTQQTLATTVYDVDTACRPGAVVLKPAQSWPTLQSTRLNGRVTITYVVGWEDVADIPQQIKHGLLMYVTYLDLDRDGMEPGANAARLAAERCWSDRVTWTAPQVCW